MTCVAVVVISFVFLSLWQGEGDSEPGNSGPGSQSDRLVHSRDGSASIWMPATWHAQTPIPDISLISVASFGWRSSRAQGISPCVPEAIPPGGAVLRIREDPIAAGRKRLLARHPARPARISIRRPSRGGCQLLFEAKFRDGERIVNPWVWANLGRGGWLRPKVRREVESMLDSLRLRPADAQPLFAPLVQLECGPLRKRCPSIRIDLRSRLPMGSILIRTAGRGAALHPTSILRAGRRFQPRVARNWVGRLRLPSAISRLLTGSQKNASPSTKISLTVSAERPSGETINHRFRALPLYRTP